MPAKSQVAITINAHDKASGVFRGIQKSAGRAFSMITKASAAAGVALGGLAVGYGAIIKSGIAYNAQLETYRNTLETVLKSQEAALDQLEWARKFAAQTPFEIPGIVEATTKLEIYGLRTREVLGTIGDMAAVMGKPLMQAIEAIADAQTGELERLKEFGITKGMLIAEGMQVNARGQIQDFKTLNDALFSIMEDRYSGGMAKMSTSWAGMISNLKDAWDGIKSELAKPAFETIKSSLKELLDWINKIKEDGQFKETIRAWGNVGRVAVETIVDGIKIVGPKLLEVANWMIKLPQYFKIVGATIKNFFRDFTSSWDRMQDWIKSFFSFFIKETKTAMIAAGTIINAFAATAWLPLKFGFRLVMSGIYDILLMTGAGIVAALAVIVNQMIKVLNKAFDPLFEMISLLEKIAPTLLPIEGIDIDFRIPEIPTEKIWGAAADEILKEKGRLDNAANETFSAMSDTIEQNAEIALNSLKQFLDESRKNLETSGLGDLFTNIVPTDLINQLNATKKVIEETGKSYEGAYKPREGGLGATTEKEVAIARKSIREIVGEYIALSNARSQVTADILRLQGKEREAREIELLLEAQAVWVSTQSRVQAAEWYHAQIDALNKIEAEEAQRKMDEIKQGEFQLQADVMALRGENFGLGMLRIEEEAQRYTEAGYNAILIEQWKNEQILALKQQEADAILQIEQNKLDQMYAAYSGYVDNVTQAWGILQQNQEQGWIKAMIFLIRWGAKLLATSLMERAQKKLVAKAEKEAHAAFLKSQAEKQLSLAAEYGVRAIAAAAMQDYAAAAQFSAAAMKAGAGAAIDMAKAAGAQIEATKLGTEAKLLMVGAVAAEAAGEVAATALEKSARKQAEHAKEAEKLAKERASVEKGLQEDIIKFQLGQEAMRAHQLEEQVKEYRSLGVSDETLGQWRHAQAAEIAGMTPTQAGGVQAGGAAFVPGAWEAPMFREEPPVRTITLEQNIYVDGWINTADEKFMRDFVKELMPYKEEAEELERE
jgi:hypothetical protein